MTAIVILLAILAGLLLFVLSLVFITYASAWVADVTGHFRTLFVRQPYSRAFRVARWGMAGLVSVAVVDALVLEALL